MSCVQLSRLPCSYRCHEKHSGKTHFRKMRCVVSAFKVVEEPPFWHPWNLSEYPQQSRGGSENASLARSTRTVTTATSISLPKLQLLVRPWHLDTRKAHFFPGKWCSIAMVGHFYDWSMSLSQIDHVFACHPLLGDGVSAEKAVCWELSSEVSLVFLLQKPSPEKRCWLQTKIHPDRNHRKASHAAQWAPKSPSQRETKQEAAILSEAAESTYIKSLQTELIRIHGTKSVQHIWKICSAKQWPNFLQDRNTGVRVSPTSMNLHGDIETSNTPSQFSQADQTMTNGCHHLDTVFHTIRKGAEMANKFLFQPNLGQYMSFAFVDHNSLASKDVKSIRSLSNSFIIYIYIYIYISI